MHHPIGTIMCSFDDGSVKVWQVATRADVLMKMMDINQKDKNWDPKDKSKEPAFKATRYDISEVGYQQFDLMDSFDIFENPHNEDIDAQEKAELKAMYSVSIFIVFYFIKNFHFYRVKNIQCVQLPLYQDLRLQINILHGSIVFHTFS